MCTIAFWTRQDKTFSLFFNRDESRLRPAAEPPRLHVIGDGMRSLHPRDPQGGGSWLAVNSRGLVSAVLNLYDAYERNPWEAGDRGLRTRGELPLRAVSFPSLQECADQLHGQDYTHYAPFVLFVLSPVNAKLEGLKLVWDGFNSRLIPLQSGPAWFSTSSFDSARIRSHRMSLISAICTEVPEEQRESQLEKAFTTLDSEDSARGLMMQRKDARTVSHSRITIDSNQVRFEYMEVPETGTSAPSSMVQSLARLPDPARR